LKLKCCDVKAEGEENANGTEEQGARRSDEGADGAACAGAIMDKERGNQVSG